MLHDLTLNVPLGPLVFLMISFFIFITYVACITADYWYPHPDPQKDMRTVDSSLRVLATGYLFLMVFIIVNTWNYKEEARRALSAEANYIASIMRAIRTFPPAEEKKIKSALTNYLVFVRSDEWRQMQNGEESEKAREYLEILFTDLQAFIPKNPEEKNYHELAIRDLANLSLARRDRVGKINSVIPGSLMDIFFILSVILIFILGIIRGKDSLNQLSPLLIFAGLLGFDFAIALDLDYPYTGTSAVKNRVYYQGILSTISDQQK